MLDKFLNLLEKVIQQLAWAGMAGLVIAVLVTVIDIVSRKTIGWSIKGIVEIMQLAVMYAAFSAIPFAFVSGSHVSVDIFAQHMSTGAKTAITLTSLVLGCLLMFSLAYFGAQQGLLEWSYNDVTMTLGISKIYFWIPLVVGSALSATLLLGYIIRLIFSVKNFTEEH
ncbi:MAG: TRAP transporter small permease [Gammaproteobacteria bacterium]|jgi:TRAP-type C4-dicarboxylate transport system permease small subunit|nr:TRAP transporter small permease [Gammaproteobacteria bacterium]